MIFVGVGDTVLASRDGCVAVYMHELPSLLTVASSRASATTAAIVVWWCSVCHGGLTRGSDSLSERGVKDWKCGVHVRLLQSL